MIEYNTHHLRVQFAEMLANEQFVLDKSGCKMLEITGASFVADSPAIFGTPNEDYIAREIAWYESLSLNVNDIPGGPPTIWKQVADDDGFINSNYGWCVFSFNNRFQYNHVLEELKTNPASRRALMIYTRPEMWLDYNRNNRSDFMCTNAVQYLIRNGKLNAVVQMRSNDVFFGYRNDRAWQLYVLDELARDLKIEPGKITWQVGSLHVYEKDFWMVRYFLETGEHTCTKKQYEDYFGEPACR